MSFLESYLLDHFITFVLVLSRVSGLVMTAPIFGSQSVPARIRGLFAVAISLLVAPVFLATRVAPMPKSTIDLAVLVGGELLVGIGLGLGILILFAGIQLTGQIISQLSGMSLADVFNPAFDAEMPVFSQLLFFVTLAVFVLIDGHRLVMGAMLDTFTVLPPGSGTVGQSFVEQLLLILSQSFVVGVRAAAPGMTALLLATFVLGLISRTLPQLNILAVGFGINSMVTMGILFLSLGGIAWIFQEQVQPILEHMQQALVNDARTPLTP